MTITVSISIDVPSLAQGVAFYCAAFGFSKNSEPVSGVAVLDDLNIELCLLEKPYGSKPSPKTNDRREFERHWTPVHLDFHVEDLHASLQRVEALGARLRTSLREPRAWVGRVLQ